MEGLARDVGVSKAYCRSPIMSPISGIGSLRIFIAVEYTAKFITSVIQLPDIQLDTSTVDFVSPPELAIVYTVG